MKQQKFAEACAAFEGSYKLDPDVSTLLNHANCREKNAQFATAWRIFLDAERQTKTPSDGDSVQLHAVAAARAGKLQARLSKLSIYVAPDYRLDGLEIMRGADRVDPGEWNQVLPIDGGTYKITAHAPGRAEWSTMVVVKPEGDVQLVAIPKLDALSSAEQKPEEQAARLGDKGEYEKALGWFQQRLAIESKNLDLLRLKGTILIKLRDYAGALATYQAYLDAGATGEGRREVQKIIEDLGVVPSTFLEISLKNGPADVYLDSRTQGVFCRAEPSCNRSVLPGEYEAIAERSGFERWTGPVTVEAGKITKLAVTLAEQSSLLTVRAEPSSARVTVDDAAYHAPGQVKAGKHRVVVSLEGYVEERREVEAQEGKPLELEVTLTRIVPIRGAPPGAELLLDGNPVAIEGAGIAMPRGTHVLVVRVPGFRDGQIEIPAEHGSDYQLDIERERVAVLTGRRKLALALGGVSLVAAGIGVALTVQAVKLQDDIQTRKTSERRGFESAAAYGVALFAVGFAVDLWTHSASGSRVVVTPRVGSDAGLDVAVSF